MSYISISMLLLLYSEGTSTLAAFCYFCIHAYMQNCYIKKNKWSSTMQQQPWSKVVRSGNKGNKGKGSMSGKAESKPAGKMGKSVNVSGASDSPSHTVSEDRDKIRVVGACRIWGTLKNSTAASIKSVITRLCKVSEIRKDKEDTVSKWSKWWYVVHESVLVRLESNWERINLQTSWKLEPCFMTVGNNAAWP